MRFQGQVAGGTASWGSITGTLANQLDLNGILVSKIDANPSIVGSTNTKITYDSKGLVTAGVAATTADITDSLDKRYVTDANLASIATIGTLASIEQGGALAGQAMVWNGVWGPSKITTLDGFENRIDSTLSFSDATRIFTISGTYNVWVANVKYAKSAPLSVTIPNIVGFYYIYFDVNANLQYMTSPWDIASDQAAPVATVYWTGTLGELADERHGAERNRLLHKYLHWTRGAAFESGFGGTFTNTTLSVTGGTIWDEDLSIITPGTSTTCRLWYRNTLAQMQFVNGSTRPYSVNGTTLRYDNAGTLTNIALNQYVVNWVYAGNDLAAPVNVVVSQGVYTSITTARAATQPNFPNISTREWKLIYSVIYRNVSGNPSFIEAADYRNVSSLPGAVVSSLPAANITYLPNGNIASTNVQSAISELDTEKVSLALGETITGAKVFSAPVGYGTLTSTGLGSATLDAPKGRSGIAAGSPPSPCTITNNMVTANSVVLFTPEHFGTNIALQVDVFDGYFIAYIDGVLGGDFYFRWAVIN